jgi:signal transduction histidine kinase
MAAGISHDLKNILNPLSLHLQFLRRAVARGQTEAAAESITEMEQVVRRGVQTVERLRDFSRQTPESKAEMVDLDRLVHEAVEIARPRLSSRPARACTVREELGAPPPVLARAADVVSAVVNLVVNAIDAVGDGSTITLRTGEARGGAWVEVSDDGPGMPPEVEQRAFEPFFTTKGDEGTGLGLAMVFACVQRHGGTVTLKTAPGEGATFTLWFPGAGYGEQQAP